MSQARRGGAGHYVRIGLQQPLTSTQTPPSLGSTVEGFFLPQGGFLCRCEFLNALSRMPRGGWIHRSGGGGGPSDRSWRAEEKTSARSLLCTSSVEREAGVGLPIVDSFIAGCQESS